MIGSRQILRFVMLYPFFYIIPFVAFEIRYAFALYYFIPFLLLLLAIVVTKESIRVLKESAVNIGLIASVVFFTLLRTDDLRYAKPAVFFLYVLIFYILGLILRFEEHRNTVIFFFGLFAVASLCFINSENRYAEGDRYSSFLISPTVFAVYAEVLLILFLYHVHSGYLKLFGFIIAGIFILTTKTRLNLLFFAMIPVLMFYFRGTRGPYVKTYLTYILFLTMLYPVYNELIKKDWGQSTLVATRYDSGRDASFGLRNHLNYVVQQDFVQNSTFMQKLFGRGTEQARKMVMETIRFDIFVHNDFLRMAYDFGIVPLLLFLTFLFRITRRNYLSFLLLLLYLFAFYHNMIYDFFMISIVLYYANAVPEKRWQKSEAVLA